MLRKISKVLVVLATAGIVNSANAFSLLGPLDTWQTTDIGYGLTDADEEIGGPMNLGEEYRWPIQTIYFAFDQSFLNFFGPRGADEIRKAVAIINALPKFSKMSSDLNEFPTDTRRVNYQALALRVYDLKSLALAFMVEQLGLANPNQYVWSLRDRVAIDGGGFSYQVIIRSFDPITQLYSPYVNNVLQSYVVLDPVPGFTTQFADAVEIPVDPFATGPTAVAAFVGQYTSSYGSGQFYTGLTRDDVAGLRYLYNKQNYNIQGLPDNTVTNASGGGGPAWTPVGSGAVVDVALRPGVDKIVLKELKFDSTLGFFIPVTNNFKDTYITNSHSIRQVVGRAINQPDFVFSAADMNRGLALRTDTGNWVNYAGTNTISGGEATITGGPGIILPPMVFTFNKVGPYVINQYSGSSFLMDEASGSPGFVWGAFDGSTNAPYIFPNGYDIRLLEAQVLQGR